MLAPRRLWCAALALWVLLCCGVARAAPFEDAFTLLPLLGSARDLATGGPTLAEIGPDGVLTNPAAAGRLTQKSLLLSLGSADGGSNYQFSYALPGSGWSVGYQSFSLGERLTTSDFNVGMARRVAGRYPLGLRVHFYDETVAGQNRSGYALDVTSLLVDDDGFSYGVGLRNLLSSVNAGNAQAPALFTAGVRYQPKGSPWALKGGLSKNFQREGRSFAQYTLGGEYALNPRFTLMGGFQSKSAFGGGGGSANLTFGLGYRGGKGLLVNYAAVLGDETLGTLHRVDVATSFDSSKPKQVAAAPVTVQEGKLPAFTPEPIRVALNVIEKDGQQITVITNETTGAPIANQEAPFVSVRTWGPEKTKPGQELELTVVFENLGQTEARSLQLFTNKPEGAQFKSQRAIGLDTEKIRFTDLGHKLLWELDTLPQGSFGEINITLALDSDYAGEKVEFFSEAGYVDLQNQPYLSSESNTTVVMVEKEEIIREPVKEKLLTSFKVGGSAIMLNTDASPNFEDLRGHWAEKDILFMKQAGLLSNLPGPYLYPDRAMDERRFYELLVLAQLYKRFTSPLVLTIGVAKGVSVEVFLAPKDSEEGVFLLDQQFGEEGEFTLALEQGFLQEFPLPPGDYDVVVQARKGSQEPELAAQPVKILGSVVDLSPGFFEDRGLAFEDGLNKLVAVYGQGGIDATFLLTLADGDHTISRLGAARALLKALGVQINEDDVATFAARSPVGLPNREEAHDRLVLTLAAQPIAERARKGLLDALSSRNPGGEDFLTRAQAVAIIYRFLEADPVDYRPLDVLAQLPLLSTGTAAGAAGFRLTAGSYISRDYAEDVADYFEDYHHIEPKIQREWVGSRHVYTVELARHLAQETASGMAREYEKSRYPVHVLAMAPSHRLKPVASPYALSPEKLEEIRQEKVTDSLPLVLPSVGDAERVNRPFHFLLEHDGQRY